MRKDLNVSTLWTTSRSTRRRVPRRALSAVALVTAASALLAACGGGSSDPGAEPGTTATALPTEKIPLTVGIVSPNVTMAGFYWALEQGIFDKVGLDVTVVSQGSVQGANLAAGKLVIADNGTPNLFPPIQEGREMVSVIAENTGNSAAAVTVRADSGIEDLMDLSGKTVGIVGCCGAAFGASSSYSKWIVDHGGEPLTIQVMPDIAGLTGRAAGSPPAL